MRRREFITLLGPADATLILPMLLALADELIE